MIDRQLPHELALEISEMNERANNAAPYLDAAQNGTPNIDDEVARAQTQTEISPPRSEGQVTNLESHMLNRVRTQHGESNPTSQQEQTTQTPASFQTESNPPSPQNEAQQVALAEEALKVLNDAKTNIKDKSKRAQKMADDLYKSQLISSDAKGTLIFRANELNR